MAAPPALTAACEHIAKRKKDEQSSRIPPEWQIPTLPPAHITNRLHIPRTCGILTLEELGITEEYDATALAEAIQQRKLKCIDVSKAFCKRAAIAHQLTNCLTEIMFDDALVRAASLDAHLESGKPPLGPLHGVPVSLKDSFKVRGYDASIGIAALAFQPASTNSILVDCLLDAGAVLYCKTNVPQTLMALDTHNNVFGRTLNPLNTRLTAGGSSGGEGALLAMRGSILGVGTDVGGSIRIPAMCNGLYGVKPSTGRIPCAGQENGQRPGLDKISLAASAGPLAHSMRDIDLFFRAVASQKPWLRDPDVVSSPWTPFSTPHKPTIGLVRHDGITALLPPIARLVDTVKSQLQHSGLRVIDLDLTPLLSRAQTLTNALFNAEGSNAMLDLLSSTNEPISPWLATRLRRRAPIDLSKLQDLHARRDALRMQFLQVWTEADVLVCPVAPHPVPEMDKWGGVNFTSVFVLLDCPAGALPVGKVKEGDLVGEVVGEALGTLDRMNRMLWTDTDRSVYLDSPLCVQVVTPRSQEEELIHAMTSIDEALKRQRQHTARL